MVGTLIWMFCCIFPMSSIIGTSTCMFCVFPYTAHVSVWWGLNNIVGTSTLFYFISLCVWWGPQHGYFILFLCFCIVGTLIHNQICYLELDWTEKIFKTSKDSRYQEKNTSIIGSQEHNARDAWTLIWMSLFGGDLNIAVLFYVSMNWCQIICNKHLQ